MDKADKALNFLDCGHVEKEISANERSITQYVSTHSVDRDNDIVLAKGIDLKNYRKNPVVLFNHQRDLPIAASLWQKPDDVGLLTKTSFSKTPFADDIYTLHLEKILNAWSIGFMPVTWEFDEKKGITTFTKIELFEYSSVSLPANPEALDEAKSIIKSTEGLYLIKQANAKNLLQIELAQFRTEIDELKRANEELALLIDTPRDDALLSSIEKLENDIDRINEEMVALSFKILKNTKAETLGINVKELVASLKS